MGISAKPENILSLHSTTIHCCSTLLPVLGSIITAVLSPKDMHFLRLTFAQIPQPIQSSSEMKAILSVGDTSIHSLPEKKKNANTF
jgi:hypothetical protein